MGAYIAYKIATKVKCYIICYLLTCIFVLKTTIPDFKNPEASVRRRFSDFLGLHSRMVAKYAGKGIVIPPAPEKSAMG